MTQGALAELFDVAEMTVSRWERGRMPPRRYWPVITEKTGGAVTAAKIAAYEPPLEAAE